MIDLSTVEVNLMSNIYALDERVWVSEFSLNEKESIRQQLMVFQSLLFGKNVNLLDALQDVKNAVDGSFDNFFGYNAQPVDDVEYNCRSNYICNIYQYFTLKIKHWAPQARARAGEIEYDLHVKALLEIVTKMLKDYIDSDYSYEPDFNYSELK